MPKRRPIVIDDDLFNTVPQAVEVYGGTAKQISRALGNGQHTWNGHRLRYLWEERKPDTVQEKIAEVIAPAPVKYAYSLLGRRHVTQMLGAARQP
jgi:hypothetical protein